MKRLSVLIVVAIALTAVSTVDAQENQVVGAAQPASQWVQKPVYRPHKRRFFRRGSALAPLYPGRSHSRCAYRAIHPTVSSLHWRFPLQPFHQCRGLSRRHRFSRQRHLLDSVVVWRLARFLSASRFKLALIARTDRRLTSNRLPIPMSLISDIAWQAGGSAMNSKPRGRRLPGLNINRLTNPADGRSMFFLFDDVLLRP